jgi:Na+-translocating ferredoxin:NAD+ oxidoreductase subunit D
MVPIATSYFALGFGTFFAIFFGKLVFGGFGQNIFNPAAAGRAAMLASFAGAAVTDITTSATPTASIAQLGWMIDKPEAVTKFLDQFGGLQSMFLGLYPGALGETSKVLILVVMVFLIIRKVIDWRIPVFYLSTVFVLASLIAVSKGMGFWYPLFHLSTGGLVFGAVFMATDPVTNPTSASGRTLFAIGLGILTVLIRVKANLAGRRSVLHLIDEHADPVHRAVDRRMADQECKEICDFLRFVILDRHPLGFRGFHHHEL